MAEAARRISFERLLQVLLVATVVSAVLASGSVLDVIGTARKARWAALIALAGAAVLYAYTARSRWRLRPPHALALAFLGLALVSTAWSSTPDLTFARGIALALIFVAGAGLALGSDGRLGSMRSIVEALVAAAAAVGLAGLFLLLVSHDRAVQPASAQEPARYQGIGGGPNTAVMVLAVAVPLAAYVLLEARTTVGRVAAAGTLLLVLGSIVASGSRGALIAAFGGLLAFALLAAPTAAARVFALVGVAALFAVSVLIMRLPDPDPSAPSRLGTVLPSSVTAAPGYLDANVRWRLQEDVGRPPFGTVPADTSRSVLGGSGRMQAWEGALRLGAERPLLGYAFGTENRVFVDRYFEHGSNQPENSYLGLFLQLGAAGIVLFGALVVSLASGALNVLRRPRRPMGGLAAACAGGLVAGLLLGLTQSYIYAAGNNATAAVWTCGFLLAAAGGALGEVNA